MAPEKSVLLSTLNRPVSASVSGYNLGLFVHLPVNFRIADNRIHWQIRREGDRFTRSLNGQQPQLNLPPGNYQIQLSIGRFLMQKPVRIDSNSLVVSSFSAAIGYLRLSANEKVEWLIQGPSGKSFRLGNRSQVNEIVPAGFYRVKAMIRQVPQFRRVQVHSGELTEKHVHIPVGEVNLTATLDNQPLFEPMEWQIYRLESGKRRLIGNFHQHIQGITIPPGRYEAVARHEQTVRSRQFWVQQNTSNQVILALD